MRKLKKIVSLVVVFLNLLSFTSVGDFFAEGSRSLTSSNTGHRPYISYNDDVYVGNECKQVVYAYVKAGETVYFGSSVISNTSSSDHTKDIVVTPPDGVTGFQTNHKVRSNGAGLIDTRDKELAGPRVNGKPSGGYTPLSFTAPKDGVYTFEFRNSGDIGTLQSHGVGDVINQDGYVAAWDISVYNDEGYRPGRVYTNFLSVNAGVVNNNTLGSIYSALYVLTDSGYLYKVDLNGMQPVLVGFFSNNTGLQKINSNRSIESAYCSYLGSDDGVTNLKDDEHINLDDKYTFHNPLSENDNVNKTYKIFFEEPSTDLPSDIYKQKATEPATISNLEFIGPAGGNTIYTGSGGVFKFDVSGETDGLDMVLTINGKTVTLSQYLVKGTNSVYWDGRDDSGNVVEVDGSSVSVKVEFKVKTGEIHFPFVDIENNSNGIKVTRINKIYDADGTTEVTNYDSKKSYVYYDNKHAINKRNSGSTGTSEIADSIDAKSGVDSSTGAMKFSGFRPSSPSTVGPGTGNRSFIDIWTYVEGTKTINLDLDVVENTKFSVSGFVFYDGNRDGTYQNTADAPFVNARVVIRDPDLPDTVYGECYTLSDGTYIFSNLDTTVGQNYEVVVYNPDPEYYDVTTGEKSTNNDKTYGTLIQNFTYEASYGGHFSMSDVGLYTERKGLAIKKIWGVDPPEGLDSIVIGYKLSDDSQKTVTLNKNAGWKAFTDDQVTEETFLYEELNIGDSTWRYTYATNEWERIRGTGEIPSYFVNVSVNGVFSADQGVTTLSISNLLSDSITIHKTDSNSGQTVGGAEYTLYKDGKDGAVQYANGDEVVVRTNENGYASLNLTLLDPEVVGEIKEGQYYFKETVSPDDYWLNDNKYYINGNTITIEAVDVKKTVNFRVKKTVDEVVAGRTIKFKITKSTSMDFTVDPEECEVSITLRSGVMEYDILLPDGFVSKGNYVKIEEDDYFACGYLQDVDSSSWSFSSPETQEPQIYPGYACGGVINIADYGSYSVNIHNKKMDTVDLSFEKIWYNQNGSRVRPSASVNCMLQVSSDGGQNWQHIQTTTSETGHSYEIRDNTYDDYDIVVARDGNDLNGVWQITLENLPTKDSDNNDLLYRLIEEGSVEVSSTTYYNLSADDIFYNGSGTQATFTVPGQTSQVTFNLGNPKNGYQKNAVIVNYEPSPDNYSLAITKVDLSDDSVRLEGAEFQLLDGDENLIATRTTDENGIAEFLGYITPPGNDGNWGNGTTNTSGNSRTITYTRDVTYYLEESKAPEGYQILPNRKEIIVTWTKIETYTRYLWSSWTLSSTSYSCTAKIDGNAISIDSGTRTMSITIANAMKIDMPITMGNRNTSIFIVCGLAFMLAATLGVLVINLNKISKGKKIDHD